MKKYSIKETSEITWLPSSTLRFYEEKGIIPKIFRDENNNCLYSEENILLIKWISCLIKIGLSLEEMKIYKENLDFEKWNFDIQNIILKEKLKKIKKEEQLLKLQKEYIKIKLNFYKNFANFSQKEINEKLNEMHILSEKIIKL